MPSFNDVVTFVMDAAAEMTDSVYGNLGWSQSHPEKHILWWWSPSLQMPTVQESVRGRPFRFCQAAEALFQLPVWRPQSEQMSTEQGMSHSRLW